jgi:general secretion pathway protein G
MNPLRRRAGGFTLIEMVVVLALVGILASAALPLHELALRRAQESALREALRTLRGAIDAHRLAVEARQVAAGRDGSPYPPTLEALVAGVPMLDDAGQPAAGRRLYLLRRLPRDPFADAALPPAQTWALRASQSPPDAPAPGSDVFDVRSRSELRALDGTRYGEW